MGMPGGDMDEWRRETELGVSSLLVGLSDARRAENVASAVLVRRLYGLVDFRVCAEAELFDAGGDADLARAERAAECEAAVALSLSRTVTREMIVVGKQLAWRLHGVDAAFAAGDLDYSRVRAIALTLVKASDETVQAIEADVLAAAYRCNAKALRERVWSRWIDHDDAEANAARKAAESEERCASIKRCDDGMASLFAKMTALEGAECDSLLEELAGTVCSRDPRSKKQLRGYALIALIHREDVIACLCGHQGCAVGGAADLMKPRRTHLLQIMISIESLLGLSGDPATLGDGTVLDPETARMIAGDARWQVFLTEVLDAARAQASPDAAPEPESVTETETEPAPAPEPEPESGGGVANSGSAGGPRAFRIIARGRVRPAASLPDPTLGRTRSPVAGGAGRARSSAGGEVALSEAIAAFLAAAAADPSLAAGSDPDGHGGMTEPPPGALTYRPSAELVALTRATYCTCTFPGCSVPAARCDIDHIVAFDHNDPVAGGWTIQSNLQPLCHYHHQAKTLKLWAAARLNGDGIFWTSCSGLRRITPSTYGSVMVPDDFVHNRPSSPSPDPATDHYYQHVADPCAPEEAAAASVRERPADDLYEPTWWETNIGENSEWGDLIDTDRAAFVPSLGDIARLEDPKAREEAIFLRERFLEHRAIVTARDRYRYPPF
ncbi:HNH endonuclease signature motif containing protein [Rhodococcus sovatensis]|uniref:DUF222 domain-containing protein n=1 Tax=Rhodococcus sovatensis TaxID=1805840 RepID=A0ABZ2PED0_9NOCA